MPQTEKIAITKKWLDRKGLHFAETLTQQRKNVTQKRGNLTH